MGNALSRLKTYLRLGRVSNLPTIWSNTICGLTLGGLRPDTEQILGLSAVFSLFYLEGMFLNDAFDAPVDQMERPNRPIPQGEISPREVFQGGFLLGAIALGLLAILGNAGSLAFGVLLALVIVAYDAWHKRTAAAPALMGLCRALIYPTAAMTVGAITPRVWTAAAGLFAYVVGISVFSRRHSPEPLVIRLIAGISLVDAMLIGLSGFPDLAALAALGYPLTLVAQRWIRGT